MNAVGLQPRQYVKKSKTFNHEIPCKVQTLTPTNDRQLNAHYT